MVGGFSFGREAMHKVELPNRDLLAEFCSSRQLVVANTLVSTPDFQKVTYHEPRASAMDQVTPDKFSMLDLVLVPVSDSHKVLSVISDRSAAIASHHFPVTAVLEVAIERVSQRKNRRHSLNWLALQHSDTKRKIVQDFVQRLETNVDSSIDDRWGAICDTAHKVVQECATSLHLEPRSANKAWISIETLALIDLRNAARYSGDHIDEVRLRKDVKRSAKRDRATWLESLAGIGDWNALRRLKNPTKTSQSRLRSLQGDSVSTECRADTFAEYLETIQWHVRTVNLIPDTEPEIHAALDVSSAPFTGSELRKAINRLKSGKSTQDKDVPIEFFKLLAESPGAALDCFLELCNECLLSHAVPKRWLYARVAMIFKKGDPALCENYRPICILSIASKILASMLKQRLLDAGVEARLWGTQFGFRRHRSTVDAIHIARRRIELACAQRQGQVSLLALDWRKAFDCINVGSLLDALRRFGLPASFSNMVASLMHGRHFSVKDFGTTSASRPQSSGISQGCTLSPLLFIIVMTVLMHDAVDLLGPDARSAFARGDLADLAFADDTLLMGVSSTHLGEYLDAVAAAGRRFGMELHYGKLQLISVCCRNSVIKPNGDILQPSFSMQYLGTVLTEDGQVSSELSRRIGQAKGEFTSLCKVWNHSSLSVRRKLHIFQSLVLSKLLYGIAACCFTVAQLRRVNGFQAKCLRQILGISHVFYSRVSNAEVLRRAGVKLATNVLAEQQLTQLGKVLRAPQTSALHTTTLTAGTLQPATSYFIRRRGRPRKEWATIVLQEAFKRKQLHEDLYEVASNRRAWRTIVQRERIFIIVCSVLVFLVPF